MRRSTMLMLGWLALAAHAESRGRESPAGAGGVDVEAAQVVWSYDTGG